MFMYIVMCIVMSISFYLGCLGYIFFCLELELAVLFQVIKREKGCAEYLTGSYHAY